MDDKAFICSSQYLTFVDSHLAIKVNYREKNNFLKIVNIYLFIFMHTRNLKVKFYVVENNIIDFVLVLFHFAYCVRKIYKNRHVCCR